MIILLEKIKRKETVLKEPKFLLTINYIYITISIIHSLYYDKILVRTIIGAALKLEIINLFVLSPCFPANLNPMCGNCELRAEKEQKYKAIVGFAVANLPECLEDIS